MNNEIPPNRTSAPTAIATMLPPAKPVPVVDVVVGVTTVGVVAVGVGAGELGSPGLNGLEVLVPGCATPKDGAPSAIPTTIAMRTVRTRTARTLR
jgi:hypothetical protein